MNDQTNRVKELETELATSLLRNSPLVDRILLLEAALHEIVMTSSYRCEESAETLEAVLASITMMAREALAPKEPT